MGKRGLYPKLGGSIKQRAANLHLPHEMRPYQLSEENILYGSELDAIRWVLFYSDGQTSLLDIAEQVGVPMKQLYDTAENLVQHGLLTREEAA